MRVAHYLNQFFAGLGAEEAARTAPVRIEGPVGPGRGLDLDVAYTLACGDDFFGEHEDEALAMLLGYLNDERPDVLVCGPAFASGRYGYACGRLGREVAAIGIPVVCGMEPENPGVRAAGDAVYVVPTTARVTGMLPALAAMSRLAAKLGAGITPEAPGREGYLPRRRTSVFTTKPAGDRALDLLLGKLRGEVDTEVTPSLERVAPAPRLADPADAVLALATEAACVPRGNPDRLPRHHAEVWHRYSLADGLDEFESVHGGFDTGPANADLNRLVPLDAALSAEREGRIGEVHGDLYTTTGNSTPVAAARRIGREMAREMKRAGVAAIVLTGT